MPGRFEVAKTGPNTHEVGISFPEWEEGDPNFRYRLIIEAENVENINIESGEWEKREVKNGKVIVEGNVSTGWDNVLATNITRVRCQVREGAKIPSFNVTYIDKTVKNPKRRTLATMQKDYTWYVSPWANPTVKAGAGVVGVVVATGIIGRWLDWW